jgi:hypothetical protein
MITTASTSSTTDPTRSGTTRRTVRALSLILAAGVVATAASAGLRLGPSVAQADPGDTFLPIGSSQLVQSEDLAAIQVRLDTEAVVLNRDNDFSACIGEGNRWSEVLPGSGKPITATWTSRRHRGQALYETIAQAATPAQATRYAKTLLDAGVRACQGKPKKWDFHYGPTDTSGVGSGFASWAVSYRGSSNRPDGGVAVIRKGTNFGIVQVTGTWGPAEQTMESVAKVAVDRLAE